MTDLTPEAVSDEVEALKALVRNVNPFELGRMTAQRNTPQPASDDRKPAAKHDNSEGSK